MLTKFNDMDVIASDAVYSCIKDGYKIDVKESIIDYEKDKDCVFRAVLKKTLTELSVKQLLRSVTTEMIRIATVLITK